MKIENIEIDYLVDYRTKKVHIKELGGNSMKPLVNTIGQDFQLKLIEEKILKREVINYDWICYCNDGLIVNYNDYQYKILNKKLPYLYEPFCK